MVLDLKREHAQGRRQPDQKPSYRQYMESCQSGLMENPMDLNACKGSDKVSTRKIGVHGAKAQVNCPTDKMYSYDELDSHQYKGYCGGDYNQYCYPGAAGQSYKYQGYGAGGDYSKFKGYYGASASQGYKYKGFGAAGDYKYQRYGAGGNGNLQLNQEIVYMLIGRAVYEAEEAKELVKSLQKDNNLLKEEIQKMTRKIHHKNYGAGNFYNYQGYGAGGNYSQYKGYGASGRKISAEKENLKPCRFCTERHIWGHRNCPAFGKRCLKCKKLNHNAKACLSRTENRQISENELTGTVRKDYRHEAEVGAKSEIDKKVEKSKSILKSVKEDITENKSEADDGTETMDESERCSSEKDSLNEKVKEAVLTTEEEMLDIENTQTDNSETVDEKQDTTNEEVRKKQKRKNQKRKLRRRKDSKLLQKQNMIRSSCDTDEEEEIRKYCEKRYKCPTDKIELLKNLDKQYLDAILRNECYSAQSKNFI